MNTKNVLRGLRDGLPIGLGYFAVAFSLGIAAKSGGITPVEGFMMSFLDHASAGEYAGITAVITQATYFELAVLILIANARYLLMSTAFSQKMSEDLPLVHRILMGFGVTDELFGLAISQPGFVAPEYYYGAMTSTLPLWALGTSLGIIAGNLLPVNIVTALSASIYGMFVAVIVPPAKNNKVVLAVILVSFAASTCVSLVPMLASINESMRIILLTLIISVAAALIKPVKEEEGEE